MGFKKRNRQISVFEYPSGFHGVSIDPSNRWVKLSHQMPWDLIEEIYATKFNGPRGNRAYSSRLAFGALFIALHSMARTIFVTFKRSWLQARHDYLERARRQAPNSQAHTAIMCLSLVRLYEMSSHGLIGFRRLFHSRAFERASVKYKVPNPFRSFHASGNPLLDKND